MTRALAIVALLAAIARADDPPPRADDYADDALVAFATTELSPLPEVGGRIDLEAVVRWHHAHLAVQGRAGGAWSFSATAGGDVFGARAGIAVGWVIPLSQRLAVVPMAGYDALALWESAGTSHELVHRFAIELPLSILVYRHVVLEPYGVLGIQSLRGSRDLAVAFGPRIGIVF
ncbi:MAG: hypothetical protein ACM31C_05110 [Acidobacteriota bacterium]